MPARPALTGSHEPDGVGRLPGAFSLAESSRMVEESKIAVRAVR